MAKIVNRAKMSVTGTPGTGTITLGSASVGFQSFTDAGVLSGSEINYVLEDGVAWEYGTGTFDGTTLTRTVIQSSEVDSAPISVTSAATVYITLFAQDMGEVEVTNVVKIAGNDGSTIASPSNPLYVAVDPSQFVQTMIFIPDTTGTVGSSGQGMPVTTEGMAGLRTVTDGATIWRDYNFTSPLTSTTTQTSGAYPNTTTLPLFNVWLECDLAIKVTVELSKDGGSTWVVQEEANVWANPTKFVSHKSFAAVSGHYRIKLINIGGPDTTRFAVWVGFSEGVVEKPIEVLGYNGYKLSEGGGITIIGVDNYGPASASNSVPVGLYDLSGNMLGMQGSVPLSVSLSSNDGATVLGGPGQTPLEVNVMNADLEVTVDIVAVAPTDRSGTITTGGAAQSLMASNSSRKGFWLQNLSAEDLYFSVVGTASAGGSSIKLAAGALYEAPASGVPNTAISIFGATTGQEFSSNEW